MRDAPCLFINTRRPRMGAPRASVWCAPPTAAWSLWPCMPPWRRHRERMHGMPPGAAVHPRLRRDAGTPAPALCRHSGALVNANLLAPPRRLARTCITAPPRRRHRALTHAACIGPDALQLMSATTAAPSRDARLAHQLHAAPSQCTACRHQNDAVVHAGPAVHD